MTTFEPKPARPQAPLTSEPYDRWVFDDDFVKAEFRRIGSGFLLRFPGEADFEIYPQELRVIGWPAPGVRLEHFRSLYHNAVLPLIGDHNGGLFLHGSAVSIGGLAAAFIGESGDGKTTLAGAFAKTGHAYLTEDVIELVPQGTGYQVQPKPSGLRLLPDSAAYLLDTVPADADDGDKIDVADAMALPFEDQPTQLAGIFLLGSGHEAALAIQPLSPQVVVQQLLAHSFILDVEDKPRLRRHFERIIELSCAVPCYRLDYVRQYSELPRVISAITAELTKTELTKNKGRA